METETPITDGTAEQFFEHYARESNVTVAFLKECGRVPRYVSGCGDYDFPHWEMGRENDDNFDRRNEIKPPVYEQGKKKSKS